MLIHEFFAFLICKKKKEEKETNKKRSLSKLFYFSSFHPREINDKKYLCFDLDLVCIGREREGEREGGRGERKSDEREVGGINDRRDKRFQGNRETNDNSLISSPIFFLDRTYAQDKLFVSG